MKEPDILLPANPRLSYLAHKDEIDSAVLETLASGRYILGEKVSLFENEFAGFIGARFAISVGNGTDALQIALRACGVGAGDCVLTVSHTAVATVCAIDLAGAKALLTDIDPYLFTMELNCLEDTIKRHNGPPIKAIIPVHIYGQPVDMREVMALANRHNLFVIEDCAQAHGASIRGQQVGTFGHFGAFSFYPTKNLGALGDGGGLVTNDENLAHKARMLRQYGWRQRYISESYGLNTRLDEIQAAILLIKLKYLEMENARRRAIAHQYTGGFEGDGLQTPRELDAFVHVYHQYVIRAENRDALKELLRSRSIETAILYPVPIHLQPGYKTRVEIGTGGLENTERVCRDILSLPMYPQLTNAQVSNIIEVVRER